MILTKENSLLRQRASEVTNFGHDELREFITNMFQIMDEKNGVGLAAPQIGSSIRLFVYGLTNINPRYPEIQPIAKQYIINPELVWQSAATTDFEEGCLSIPGIRGIVARPKHIKFKTFDIDGHATERSASDFEARIILHELDHLDGILFIDRASSLRNTA